MDRHMCNFDKFTGGCNSWKKRSALRQGWPQWLTGTRPNSQLDRGWRFFRNSGNFFQAAWRHMNTVIFSFKKDVSIPTRPVTAKLYLYLMWVYQNTDKNKRLESCTYECIAGDRFKLFRSTRKWKCMYLLCYMSCLFMTCYEKLKVCLLHYVICVLFCNVITWDLPNRFS